MKVVNYKLGKEIVKNSKYKQSLIDMKRRELKLQKNIKESKSEVATLRDTLMVNKEAVVSATQTTKEVLSQFINWLYAILLK